MHIPRSIFTRDRHLSDIPTILHEAIVYLVGGLRGSNDFDKGHHGTGINLMCESRLPRSPMSRAYKNLTYTARGNGQL